LMVIGIVFYLNFGLVEKSEIFSISQVDLWLSVGALIGLVGLLHYSERQVNRRLICYFLNYCHQLPKSPSMLLDAYRDEELSQTTSPQMNNMNNSTHMNRMNVSNQVHQMSGQTPQQRQPINRLDYQPETHDYLNDAGTKKIPVSIIQCPICHSDVKSIYNFCFECGTKLDERK
ncbi:MAG: zinc ribbon domain-containing protein, partial [Candidatus Heimdallarchaeota archaeon]|nr:zinc ribbon domain-containing protein [Candidatus Heimdallarchaeota archaeon]MCK5048989.1 zinc ribbon domain-containing protein [Candidatus Heimdallarchaeota archaeon]